MNGPLLVLDPGHGGSQTAGASSPNRGTGPGGLLEKDVALDLARRTRDRLTADHVVVLTRDSDTNLTLAERAETAKRLGAAAFVSLHLSGKDPAVDRTDVVVGSSASTSSRSLADNIWRMLTEATGSSGEILEADLGQIAAQRHDPSTAACLVEVASLAAPHRAALLADPAYLDKLADALAVAIRRSVATPASNGAMARGSSWGRAAAIVTPEIDYAATSLVDAVVIWADWLGRYAQWSLGVPDSVLSSFPHAAICQLRLHDAAGNTAHGTGFYIDDEVILTCGHNFYDVDSSGTWVTTSVDVQPAYSPRMTVLASKTFSVDGRTLVHPRWLSSGASDNAHDLAVLRVPGLPATAGVFNLANVSLAQSAGIVVCGYGKVDGTPNDDQGQRMDGAHIADSDFDLVYYPIQTVGGHSGSPVFHGNMVIGVHTGPRMRGSVPDQHQNRGVLLTPDKEDWIVRVAGPGVEFGRTLGAYSLTDQNSGQREQSDQVRLNVARSVGLAETSLRYDLVHDDSARVNFGIGSWTGSRIADLLDTYATYAAEVGATDQMLAHFGGRAGFDAIRTTMRTGGAGATLTTAQREQLTSLGRRVALQPAQDRHLAGDIRGDLNDIGSNGNPWYPFIDGGMGAISEIAAHVLVHARHQSGGAGLRARLQEVIASFGGDAALGQAMVDGTVTERIFLERLAERVVARVGAQYQNGVRRRYERLWTDWGSSVLSYYFNPAN